MAVEVLVWHAVKFALLCSWLSVLPVRGCLPTKIVVVFGRLAKCSQHEGAVNRLAVVDPPEENIQTIQGS